MKHATPLLVMLLASCAHPPPPIPVIDIPLKTGAAQSVMVPRTGPISIDLLNPDIFVDLNWLDLEGFYPPGADRIAGGGSVLLKLAPMARVRFPSMEIARSPDQQNILFHDGLPKSDQIYHWLLLLNSAHQEPRSIYGTSRAFDVVWAPNSRLIAITTYLGENSSEVSVVAISGERHAIDVRGTVRARFPSHVWEASMFVKAYRWSTDSHLILRCVGRSSAAPFDVFGAEIIAYIHGDSVTMSFNRGFIKWSRAKEPHSPAGKSH